MAYVKIRDQSINIDIHEELEAFEWERARWSHDKLIAASPFRYDKSPSFFVNLEGEYAGCWGDSGAYDDEWKSGGIVKLLAFLRNETTEEVTEYLTYKYGDFSENSDKRLILPKMRVKSGYIYLSRDTIIRQQSPYLTKRGISADIQLQAGVGKSQHYGFVAIPWHSPDGRLANVKYRSTRGKMFFYEKDSTPIGALIYGADIYVKSTEDLIVCEAEIDALSWRTAGYNAVAVGGVAFTDKQRSILARLPFNRLLVAGDNDKAGQAFNARVVNAMRDRDVSLVQWRDDRYKDANDVLVNGGVRALQDAAADSLPLPRLSVKLSV